MQKKKLSPCKYRMLYRMFWLARKSETFCGSEIERFNVPENKMMMAETKKVRFRELNAQFGIAEYQRGTKSKYKFTMSPREILEAFNETEPSAKLIEPIN